MVHSYAEILLFVLWSHALFNVLLNTFVVLHLFSCMSDLLRSTRQIENC